MNELEVFTKGQLDAQDMLNRNFSAIMTDLDGKAGVDVVKMHRTITPEEFNRPYGMSYLATMVPDAAVGPYQDYWAVDYTHFDAEDGVQEITAIVSGKKYFRVFYGRTAGAWQRIATDADLSNKANIINGWVGAGLITFDNATTPGAYGVNVPSNTPGLPPEYAGDGTSSFYGLLIVDGTGDWIWQTLHGTGGGNPMVRRRINQDPWAPWIPLATATPPQEHALPLETGVMAREGLAPLCRYSKDQFGQVCVHFSVVKVNGSAFTSMESIATLPVGYRPSDIVYGVAAAHASSPISNCGFGVHPNGRIVVYPANDTDTQNLAGSIAYIAH